MFFVEGYKQIFKRNLP